MTETFGVLGDPRKWKKGPVKVKTTAECHAEWEEHRRHEREVEQLIDEALEGRAAKHLAGERQANEAKIASYVDQMIADELLRFSEPRLPSDRQRAKFMEIWREFAEWCRATGVDALPASGPVMFLWLVEDDQPSKVSQRVRALRFVHDVSREHFDTLYTSAAERWARIVKKPKKESKDNGS